MEITFFEDPLKRGKAKEEVRFKQIGLFVYDDRRRVAVGFDITPSQERPSIDIEVVNANGDYAGSMQIVDIVESNFTLTLHLRDQDATDLYQLTALLYFVAPDSERLDVDRRTLAFDVRKTGTQPVSDDF
jgi:hypothetical protein